MKRVVLSAFILLAGSSVFMLTGCPDQGKGPGDTDFSAPPPDLEGQNMPDMTATPDAGPDGGGDAGADM